MARQGGEDNKPRAMVSSTGYCYSDVVSPDSHMVNPQFDPNNPSPAAIYSMEMISLLGKAAAASGNHHFPGGAPSSSKAAASAGDFYHHQEEQEPYMVAPERLLMYDSSSLRCVFPCEGNEKPSQGLSLSLSSSNPSSIGLQSFELRQQDDLRFVSSGCRPDGFFVKQTQTEQNNINMINSFQIRNSKYLGPAQELLNEFCFLGTKQMEPKTKVKRTSQWQDENNASSSSRKQALYNLELIELQKRKAKLLSMLEEVDSRYRHYCDQMKAVVSSFESVAGTGAAQVYSALASKAMSRHFRSLRDGIVDQIRVTKKAMGEKDTAAPGTARGETPRLRLLDQTLRQQKAFQQMSMMESHPWRPQRGLPERSVSVLRAWLFEHFLHPYPSDVDKHILARQTGLSRSQVSNWFINARVRLWKPMIEEMYMEETKELEESHMASRAEDQTTTCRPSNEDQKPDANKLVRIESECLSSIINNSEKNDSPAATYHRHHQPFGTVELDFSAGGGTSYATTEGFGSGSVSLTLGLQQHGGGRGCVSDGVSLAFSPAAAAASAAQSSLFYPRDHIEEPVQYSLLDGEGQALPYRNLMGAQLLHDLAG
ncbi:hypothetical protein NMG60_11027056 [Bertholletia excelsa]